MIPGNGSALGPDRIDRRHAEPFAVRGRVAARSDRRLPTRTLFPVRRGPNPGWPANLVLDEEAGALLDEQSGELTSGARSTRGAGPMDGRSSFAMPGQGQTVGYGDSGGASRFFYCAKASKKDRGEGNTHPTVKPNALMRWLVRLVTPPGGLVLDPFCGSGSTGVAALEEGFQFTGIEKEAEYAAISVKRLVGVANRWEARQLRLFAVVISARRRLPSRRYANQSRCPYAVGERSPAPGSPAA